MNIAKLLSPTVSFRLLWFSFFGLAHPFQGLSQIHYEKRDGTVIDSATTQPIPQVNVWTRHSHTVSDVDGNFSLQASPDDTLYFSHISYDELVIRQQFRMPHSKIRIALHQKITLLDEVKIYSYLSEYAFRQKIIETTPVLSREEEIAQINSKIIAYLARYAPTYPMDANDNYIDYMKGPQGVVIFSSNPTKGLIRAIKNVVSPNLPAYKRFLHSDSSMRALRYR